MNRPSTAVPLVLGIHGQNSDKQERAGAFLKKNGFTVNRSTGKKGKKEKKDKRGGGGTSDLPDWIAVAPCFCRTRTTRRRWKDPSPLLARTMAPA